MPLQTDIFSHDLAKHYTHFDVANRLLFTGHSHQAWPDVARDAMIEAFDVSAAKVDTKWDVAFEKIEVMLAYLRNYYDDPDGLYTHNENTHNLIVRWLSALDLVKKPHIVTTDSEFYSLYRQLSRMSEENVDVTFVPALPLEGFSDRIASAITEKTAAVMISRVYFETSLINSEISEVGQICREKSVPLMIDDYHGTNVVPLSLRNSSLEDAYFLIGGYKYLQWGEGNCFLRFPKDCSLRPVATGWFASFSTLKQPRAKGPVQFDEGDMRFAGATFDGTSAYRGAAVAEFFVRQNLTPKVLHKVYQEQVAYMKHRFLSLDLSPSKLRLAHDYSVVHNGGFLSLRGAKATEYWQTLKDEGVLTDCRGEILRFGAAPYLVSGQMDEALDILKSIVNK